ncbi:MAG: metal ABC transporter permease [Gemmatimonadetes bacterium]|nr:metal ABC transporter permease [Gemmatimonadota bacterium]
MLELLLPPFFAAMIILLTHAYFGLHVIQREVIFVDLALAQIAALGATVAFMLGAEHGSGLLYAFSFGFTLVGALVFSLTRLKESPVPQEALIGITFVVASAAVILLAGFASEGTEYVKETLTGSLIWVTWPAVLKVAVSYGAIGLFHILLRRTMLAITWAPERVRHLKLWDFVFYATFGIASTSSVQIAGVLMVFSVLVIPAVVAFFYARRFRSALLLAWGSGTVAIVAGLGISFYWDIATGPVLVVSFGAILVLALLFRGRFGVRVRDPADRGLKVAMFEASAAGD